MGRNEPSSSVLTGLAAVERARRDKRPLLESEVYGVVQTLGIGVPEHRYVRRRSNLADIDLESLPGERVVVKAVAHGLLHKTEIRGVQWAAKDRSAIGETMAAIDASYRATGGELSGFLLCEHVEHDRTFGHELLLSVRWTDDFGAVVSLGPGGTQAESQARLLENGRAVAILSPQLRPGAAHALDQKQFLAAIQSPSRNQPPAFSTGTLEEALARALDFAQTPFFRELDEIELNPVVSTTQGLVALDAMVRPALAPHDERQPRRRDGARHLLAPRSIAVVGVSGRGMNPGRQIVRRLKAVGYRGKLVIVKPGVDSVDGVPCVADLDSLEEPIDLLVLAVGAEEATALLERAVELESAESVLLIPGGFEEHSAHKGRGSRVRQLLEQSRRQGRPTPVVNGGNCLGVRSLSHRVDTLFIPERKLPLPAGNGAPLAIVSQSGAFAIARESTLADLAPRVVVSVGNQVDLTIGDYLTYLAGDSEIDVVGCYVEGFRPLDGLTFLEAVSQITDRGGSVILFPGARTQTGASAAASHTAAIAGAYAVTRELTERAGGFVAESIDEFDDLVRLACHLLRREPRGRRVGALSNAGFECVVMADGARSEREPKSGLVLAALERSTRERLESIFSEVGLVGIVGIRNPLDVTPMAGDVALAKAAELLLHDSTVDVGVVGCVPLTGALTTLADSDDNVGRGDSVASLLGALFSRTKKPWVTVVDSGSLYDPMAHVLERHGLPVFRSADRALRSLSRWVDWRLRVAAALNP